jgi:hypothetical protein
MNQMIRAPMTSPATTGNWMWDGTQWVCSTGTDIPPFPCPPPGFPPPGCPPWFSGENSPPWHPGANAGVSFGTAPPTNPVRGHFWWDGTGLALFDGAAWVAITNAAIVPPGQTIGSVSGSTGTGNGGTPGTGLVGPIIGVTDGSMAQPGQVGELINSGDISTTMALNASGTTTQNFVLFSALPAGDWDLDLIAGPIDVPGMAAGTYSVVVNLTGQFVHAADQAAWTFNTVTNGSILVGDTVPVYGWVSSNAPSLVQAQVAITGTLLAPATAANAGINVACRARRRR